MTREKLVQKIIEQAKIDAKNRQDPRFLNIMGFLVAKGFLRTNLKVQLLPNKRLKIDDAIWAGQNVEPRILEVLPAAVLRLEKHFDLDEVLHEKLVRVIKQLRRHDKSGEDFFGMPYKKIKLWVDFPLPDRRVKTISCKKIVKSFRLSPAAVLQLKKSSKEKKCSETEILETLLLKP